MEVIKKVLQLTKDEYYERHLSIINCFLPVSLTETEAKVLARFMALEGDIATDRFGPTGKRLVMDSLNITPSGLSNYMNSLLKKKYLYKKIIDNKVVVDMIPILFPESLKQNYLFTLINIDNDTGS